MRRHGLDADLEIHQRRQLPGAPMTRPAAFKDWFKLFSVVNSQFCNNPKIDLRNLESGAAS
jgi:hypothetical protein